MNSRVLSLLIPLTFVALVTLALPVPISDAADRDLIEAPLGQKSLAASVKQASSFVFTSVQGPDGTPVTEPLDSSLVMLPEETDEPAVTESETPDVLPEDTLEEVPDAGELPSPSPSVTDVAEDPSAGEGEPPAFFLPLNTPIPATFAIAGAFASASTDRDRPARAAAIATDGETVQTDVSIGGDAAAAASAVFGDGVAVDTDTSAS